MAIRTETALRCLQSRLHDSHIICARVRLDFGHVVVDAVELATVATAVLCAQSSSRHAKARTASISYIPVGEGGLLADPAPTLGQIWHRSSALMPSSISSSLARPSLESYPRKQRERPELSFQSGREEHLLVGLQCRMRLGVSFPALLRTLRRLSAYVGERALNGVDGRQNEPIIDSSRLCSLRTAVPVGAIIRLKRGSKPRPLADEATDKLACASLVTAILEVL